jgi:hypothetical protein
MRSIELDSGSSTPEIQSADDFDAFIRECWKSQDELITLAATAGNIPVHTVASLLLPVIIQHLSNGIPDRERVKAILCEAIDSGIPAHFGQKGGLQ